MVGLGGSLVVFLALALLGLVDGAAGQVTLIFVQFLGLMSAGYVAGRLAPSDEVLNGGLAALAVFAVVAALSLVSASPPGAGAVVFLGAIAAILGSAGGVLAAWRRQPPIA